MTFYFITYILNVIGIQAFIPNPLVYSEVFEAGEIFVYV
jgi:hypothetical protein